VVGLSLVMLYARNVHSDYLHEPHWARFKGIAYEYRGVLATAGIVGVSLMLMRSARNLMIPLIGENMGLDVATIGVIFSIGAAVDLTLFYPAGQIMDRYGRKWTAVPGMTLFALGFASLLLADGVYSLLAATCLIGIGNGLTTGIFLTLGSDFAPSQRRGEFLGIWRLMGDAGHTGAPFLVGSLVKLASLSASALAVSLVGLAGTAVMLLLVKETLRKPQG
jgi:MFS family permease